MEEKEINNEVEKELLNPKEEMLDQIAADAPESSEEAAPISETDQLKANLEAQKDKFLRLMAEFENFKRRTAKERIELIQTAGKDVIVSLLDVLDDCERAEKQLETSDNIELQKEGILLVFNKIRSALHAKGLRAMDSIDKDFDVELHEAITEIPVPDASKKGKVIDEVTKGYVLNEKIIRFAKVVVGK